MWCSVIYMVSHINDSKVHWSCDRAIDDKVTCFLVDWRVTTVIFAVPEVCAWETTSFVVRFHTYLTKTCPVFTLRSSVHIAIWHVYNKIKDNIKTHVSQWENTTCQHFQAIQNACKQFWRQRTEKQIYLNKITHHKNN